MSDGDKDRSSRDRSRRDRPARFSETSRDRSSDRGGRDRNSMKSSNNRVYVSNIPYEYRWQDMKDLFRNEVGDVQFVELFLDDNDKPKGCGIVEFSDSSLVKKCLEVMQRFEVKGRKLVVREDSGNMRDKHGNIVGGSGGNKRSREDRDRHNRDDRDRHRDGGNNSIMMRQDDGAKWGNTYGLSPHFLESLNIEAPLSNKVFVANLEYNIDKKKLKEVFRIAGRVVRVDIHTDKDGRSRGFAVVEYDHPVEAVQAISMLHNQVLFDRTMTVRMDRANELLKLPEGLKTVGMGLGPNGEPLRNVSHNLPNSSNQSQNVSGVGAGLLGAVPNNALQAAASALSGLNNVPGLGNINPSVLQAANLSGFASNLLQNGLGNAQDLSSLVQPSPLMQNTQQQLAALAASNASSNSLSGLGLNPSGGGYPFKTDGMAGRTNDNSSFNPNQPVSYPPTHSYPGRAGTGGYQDSLRSSSFTTPTSLLKSSSGGAGGGGGDSRGGGGNSRKVLISNLPPSANYQLLQEKLNEFGEVSYWEEKGTGSFLVVYGNEWQAERAIRNLDKARIDGRLVDARMYY